MDCRPFSFDVLRHPLDDCPDRDNRAGTLQVIVTDLDFNASIAARTVISAGQRLT